MSKLQIEPQRWLDIAPDGADPLGNWLVYKHDAPTALPVEQSQTDMRYHTSR